jgi:PKD repeat protein
VIVFDGSRSSDPDGNISKWFWLFGDETNGTGMIVQHIYSKPGTYNVSLTVTDNDGDTNSKTTTCIIAQPNRPPTPPTITGPLHGTRNTMYSYTMVSTDKDNDVLRYAVEWGDSSPPVQSSGFLPDGTSFSVNHSWQNAGRYDITVSASDNQTETSSKITVYIDAEQTGDIGYLMDTNSDGIYDSFYSDITKKITMVQEQNGLYNIDSDGDGTWDYTFNATNGLAVWQAPNTPGFAVVLTLSAITVVLFWKRKSKMKN